MCKSYKYLNNGIQITQNNNNLSALTTPPPTTNIYTPFIHLSIQLQHHNN